MAKFQRGSLVLNKNSEELNSNKVLYNNSDQLQFLKPLTDNIEITLPAVLDSVGNIFWIINTSASYSLLVNGVEVKSKDIVCFMSDGNTWEADTELGGKVSRSVETKTTSYNMTSDDDVILANATSGILSIKLPDPTDPIKRNIDIKKVDSSTNIVNINPYNTETIDGVTSKSLTLQYESITLISDGTNWNII